MSLNTAPRSPWEELNRLLSSWLRWYRIRRAVVWAVRGVAIGLAAAIVYVGVELYQHNLLRIEMLRIVLIASLLAAAFSAAAAYLWPIQTLQAARRFDRFFRLQERVSTALELGVREEDAAPDLHYQQLQDALHAARQVQPRRLLPIRLRWPDLLIAGSLLAFTALLAWQGENLFQAAAEKRALQLAIEQEAEQVEALLEEIEANQQLTPEQREALSRPLEEALTELRSAETREQAVSVLAAAEEELTSLEDSQSEMNAQTLQDVGNTLAQVADSPLNAFAENLTAGEMLQAAQELSNLELGELSGEQVEQLAGQMEEAARALAGTDSELSQALEQAAQALRQGDSQAAEQALEQAAQSLRQSGQQLAQSQAAEQAAGETGEARQRLLQPGQSAAQLGDQPGSSGEGQEGSPGEGQPGSGSGQSSQGQSSGAGEGEGNGASEPGGEAGGEPIDQNNRPGDGGERLYEQIYAPERIGGEGTDEVMLPGSDQPGDLVTGEGEASPGDPDQSRVPYVEVLPYYQEAYREAIDSGQIPPSLRDWVRDYFSSLEP